MAVTADQRAALKARGLSDEQIDRFAAAPPAASAPAKTMRPALTEVLASMPNIGFGSALPLQLAAQHPSALPAALAAPGGFVPGPLGWGMSAAGGTLGEAGRQALMGEHLNPLKMGEAGAVQGGLGMAGSAIAKPISWLGQRTLAAALGASPKAKQAVTAALSRAAGRKLGPIESGIGKVMARERVGVTEGSLKNLQAKIEGMTAQVNALADKAGQRGVSFTVDDFMAPLKQLRQEIGEGFDAIPEVKQLDAMINRFRSQLTGPRSPYGAMMGGAPPKKLTPRQVLALRRQWDSTAKRIYEQAAQVGGGPESGLRAQAASAAATGARQALHGIPGEGQQIAQINQRMSELIPLRDAVHRALLQNSGASVPFIPPMLGQMVMPQAIRSRTVTSGVGMGLTDPTFLGVVRNLPRGTLEALGIRVPPEMQSNGY